MNAIADALVYAVAYINCRNNEGDDDRADVRALESIAGFLANSTSAEQDELAAAANRALAAEKRMAKPREHFLRDYANWMEETVGEGWEGNSRIPE